MTNIDTIAVADVAPVQSRRRLTQHDSGSARQHATLSKSATVIKLLSRAKGASLAEVTAVTSWQPHSVRAFLSGLRKKGKLLTREQRKNGEHAYQIAEGVTSSGGTTASPTMSAATPDAVA